MDSPMPKFELRYDAVTECDIDLKTVENLKSFALLRRARNERCQKFLLTCSNQAGLAVRGWEKSSDHAPVWIELSDKTKRRRRSAQL
jgi:hypothetical protein